MKIGPQDHDKAYDFTVESGHHIGQAGREAQAARDAQEREQAAEKRKQHGRHRRHRWCGTPWRACLVWQALP